MKEYVTTSLFIEAAKRAGCVVELIQEFPLGGKLVFPDKTYRYFRLASVGANNSGSIAIAKDKWGTQYFLGRIGVETINTIRVTGDFSSVAQDKVTTNLPFPLVVKPNSCSRAKGISIVADRSEVESAFRVAEQADPYGEVLFQEFIDFPVYRFVVLKGEVVLAYKKNAFGAPKEKAQSIVPHDSFFKVCQAITRELQLDWVGIDFLIKDYTRPAEAGNYYMLEVNSSPMLKSYASVDTNNKEEVIAIFEKLIDHLHTQAL